MSHYPDQARNWAATRFFMFDAPSSASNVTLDNIFERTWFHPLGGGHGYVQTNNPPTREDCDRVVSSRSQLAAASGSGDLVWVDGAIGLGTWEMQRIENVTLVGDYGHSPGPTGPNRAGGHGSGTSMLWTNATGYRNRDRVIRFGNNVTLLGLKIRGPNFNAWDNDEYHGYMPRDDGRFERAREFGEVRGRNFRVINCEIWGWGIQGFRLWNDAEFLHVYGHDNMCTSLGYFFTCYRNAHALVDYCLLNAHRHDVNGFCHASATYTVRNSLFGPSRSSHAIDMHALDNNTSNCTSSRSSETYCKRGGGSCLIERNTFLFTNVIHGPDVPAHSRGFDRGRWHWVYSNRGVPQPGEEVIIRRNSMMHHGPQTSNSGRNAGVRRFTPDAFVQSTHGHSTNSQEFARVRHMNNAYDNARQRHDPREYGAPIDLWDPESYMPAPERLPRPRGFPRERGKALVELLRGE